MRHRRHPRTRRLIAQVLHAQLVTGSVLERRRQQQSVRRRAEGKVQAVKLKPRRAIPGSRERRVVTDQLVGVDASEDPLGPGVVTDSGATERPGLRRALRGEAHADELLRGAAAVPPQPPTLTSRGVMPCPCTIPMR